MDNLPNLPPEGTEPDGTILKFTKDSHGRWVATIWENGFVIDIFMPNPDINVLWVEVTSNYPYVTYRGEDD